MLVESASYRNIQPLQGGLVARGRGLFYSHAATCGAGLSPEAPGTTNVRPAKTGTPNLVVATQEVAALVDRPGQRGHDGPRSRTI